MIPPHLVAHDRALWQWEGAIGRSPIADGRCIICLESVYRSGGPNSMATGNQLISFEAVWDAVRKWPAAQRRSLASQIMVSLASENAGPGTARAGDLVGAWRDTVALDDAAVQALLEDELLRNHG
jgi:hypothetical protein